MSSLRSKGCLFLASSLCDGLEDNNIKQVTTLLLNKEADPNTLIPTHGVTPFHLVIGNDSEAFAEEVTKLFLRHGGNPNVRSVDGLTPVHVAAAWGRVSVLDLLLANGGDPLCLDDEGRSPFHYAFDGKYYKAIVTLGKYCDNTTKEDKAVKYKITFDKLKVTSGNVIAEYAASYTASTIEEDTINEKECKLDILSADVNHKINSYDLYGINVNNNICMNITATEHQIRETMKKEKFLVDKIIKELSDTLKTNSKGEDCNEKQEDRNYDTSPSSTLSTDSSMSMKERFTMKIKTRKSTSMTPKYRRKNLGQNGHTRIPLVPYYDPSESIISKSPNFFVNRSVDKEQRYLSPKASGRDPKIKSYTPCMTRTNSFRTEEFNLGRDVARSTPRRRKRFFRQCSSHRKLRKNDENSSPENTSPDSITTFSPNQTYVRKLCYKFSKDLAIKLDENKYDEDGPGEYNDYKERHRDNSPGLRLRNVNVKEVKSENIFQDRYSDEEFEWKADNTLNTFKENLNTFLSSFKSQTLTSVQEEYKYESVDEGVAFLERRIYTIPPCKASGGNWGENLWPQSLNLSINMCMSDEALREKLISLGDNPGPITGTTRQLYLKRLVTLKSGSYRPPQIESNHSKVAQYETRPFLMYGDWVNDLGRYRIIEKNAFKEFSLASPSRKWREGMNKTCFNYLLLDPRTTKDLPSRSENLSKSTIWNIFLSAIFYVGKGTRNRPYSHLKDAFDAWISDRSSNSAKIQRILNIWNEGHGVVCLHLFQNSIPVEAYTREAAIIDALGLQMLHNCKSGDYYGIIATWNIEEKCNFGRYLLHQAMQIFLFEGERQIFPQNL